MLSPADHKIRSKGIGSSEIAMLVYVPDENGDMRPLSPWGGKHKLWRRKTGKDGEQKTQHHMTRGQYMEDGLMRWYASENGVEFIKPKTLTHPKYPYVVDSCDGLTFPKGTTIKAMKEHLKTGGGVQPLRCLEAKCSAFWKRDEWGEAGSDEVPPYYLVQSQWHLGAHMPQDLICDLPMDNGIQRTDYQIHYDEELYLSLVTEAEKFWQDYVLANKEPPVDDYSDATSWLSRYLKQREGMGLREADDEQVKLMLRYKELALGIKADDAKLEEMKEQLMRAIGDHDGLVIQDTKIKIIWRQSKDTVGVDWKAFTQALSEGWDPDEVIKLEKKHSGVTRKGSRRWTPTALLKSPDTANTEI